MWFGEEFTAMSSWESKMSIPIIDLDKEVRQVMQKKKGGGRDEPQDIFYTVQNFAYDLPKGDETVMSNTCNNPVIYKLGKTFSLE